MKKSILLTILFLFFSAKLSVSVFATTDILWSSTFHVSVDGQVFYVPGYENLDNFAAFRLRDIAYILNRTTAQFDIIESNETGYWIKRGAAYTVTSMVLRHFPERWAVEAGERLSYSESRGFTHWPFQRTALGFDGGESPAVVINLTVVQDIDDMFFSLRDLSYWLGFGVEYINFPNSHFISQIEITTTPQNVPTPSRFIGAETFPIGSRQVINYAHTLTVRTAPRNDSRILTFVHRGDEFEIMDYSGRFVQIETEHGRGWIFAGFLSRCHAAAEPVFVPPPPPDGIIGSWTFEKRTESYQPDGEETEIPLQISVRNPEEIIPRFHLFSDKSFHFRAYYFIEGYLVQITQYEFLVTNQIAFSESFRWYRDDDIWLRYLPESRLLRFSFFNPYYHMYIHYYFTRAWIR